MVEKTQIEAAKRGVVTEQMQQVAESEGLDEDVVRHLVAEGRMVILYNPNHSGGGAAAVGHPARTKVNANIGTSEDRMDVDLELAKLRAAIAAGTDTVMDLSTGGDLDKIRRRIIAESSVPVGSVPIYQTVKEAVEAGREVWEFDADALFADIEKHAEDGISFVTVHCGVTRASLERLHKQGRIMGIVSRGGAFLARYIEETGRENPLYEQFDRLLEIAKKYDLTLSLGDGLRPGCLSDATDRAQIEELITLGELRKRALEAGVQVMIEGPGHLPLNQVEENMRLQKELTNGAPFYVLGPVVIDIAPGFDHIVAAIGGAVAALCGADFLCYVTPSEHIRLPDVEDVVEGVVGARIAAHAADVALGIAGAAEKDREMALARASLDWKTQERLAIHPHRFRAIRASSVPRDPKVCTMCGRFCALKVFKHKE
ncbi:MAG: phosphomethylpyrimidine synthase [Planctomycetota bacterium]|nr:MAG: phosphomethylpyrimidine synthase [Planctomycetota bacterium]